MQLEISIIIFHATGPLLKLTRSISVQLEISIFNFQKTKNWHHFYPCKLILTFFMHYFPRSVSRFILIFTLPTHFCRLWLIFLVSNTLSLTTLIDFDSDLVLRIQAEKHSGNKKAMIKKVLFSFYLFVLKVCLSWAIRSKVLGIFCLVLNSKIQNQR